MTGGLTLWRTSVVKSGVHSQMTAIQLIGVAPAWTSRSLGVFVGLALIPPEQSLTKKTRYPSAIAEIAGQADLGP